MELALDSSPDFVFTFFSVAPPSSEVFPAVILGGVVVGNEDTAILEDALGEMVDAMEPSCLVVFSQICLPPKKVYSS